MWKKYLGFPVDYTSLLMTRHQTSSCLNLLSCADCASISSRSRFRTYYGRVSCRHEGMSFPSKTHIHLQNTSHYAYRTRHLSYPHTSDTGNENENLEPTPPTRHIEICSATARFQYFVLPYRSLAHVSPSHRGSSTLFSLSLSVGL
jgi:hypothetical protein